MFRAIAFRSALHCAALHQCCSSSTAQKEAHLLDPLLVKPKRLQLQAASQKASPPSDLDAPRKARLQQVALHLELGVVA